MSTNKLIYSKVALGSSVKVTLGSLVFAKK